MTNNTYKGNKEFSLTGIFLFSVVSEIHATQSKDLPEVIEKSCKIVPWVAGGLFSFMREF